MSLLYTNTGSYLPGFFQLTLDTKKPIPPIKEMDNETLDVFIHEYVHYIQDVTTSAGYHNLYVISEYLRSVINRIYKEQKAKFAVPYEIMDNNDNVVANTVIEEVTSGSWENCHDFKIKYIKTEHCAVYQVADVRKITLISKKGEVRIFGSIAIKESMAYLFEQTCGFQIKSDDYPYNVARLVASRYSHAIASDPVKLIALCDMSLLCSNPGGMFVTFLELVKKKQINIKKAEDIVDWFYSAIFIDWNNKPVCMLSHFRQLHEGALKSVISYIKGIDIENDIVAYFKCLFSRAFELRNNDPYFIIHLARGGRGLENEKFIQIVSVLGFPILKNLEDERYLFENPIGDASIFQYFSAISEILQLFKNGKEGCGMSKWCKESKLSTYNYYCSFAPWRKVEDEKLCPFAMLWKHWNLAKYTPVSSKTSDDESLF